MGFLRKASGKGRLGAAVAASAAVVAGMVFLFKAGTLSGQFYLYALGYFVTAVVMAVLQRLDPVWNVGHLLFGTMSAASFFFPGRRYYRQRKRGEAAS